MNLKWITLPALAVLPAWADLDSSAAKLYAGLYPNSMIHQMGSFVINKRRKIMYAYVNQDFRSCAATISLIATVRKSR